MTTDRENDKKLVLIHQVSQWEFQIQFKFGIEEKMWQKKYKRRFVEVEIKKASSIPRVLSKFNRIHMFLSQI